MEGTQEVITQEVIADLKFFLDKRTTFWLWNCVPKHAALPSPNMKSQQRESEIKYQTYSSKDFIFTQVNIACVRSLFELSHWGAKELMEDLCQLFGRT